MTTFDAADSAVLMKQHGVTHTSGTDDLLKRMLDATDEKRPFPHLRECVYAGFNPTLSRFPEEAEQRGMHLLGCFGMSEIHSFFSRQKSDLPVEHRKRPGGVPVTRGTVVRARDTESGKVLAGGMVGELEIWSPNMFSVYYRQPEATKAAFTEDGFFRTGDFGRTFEDGSYEFVGRRGDFMRLAGFLVNPLDIELELQAVPGIKTAIVVEAPSVVGTRAIAFIKLQPGAAWDENLVKSHCESRLANFKVPALFVPVEDLPTAVSPNGEKVQRGKLKAIAAALMEEAFPVSAGQSTVDNAKT
jgi:fatty-acyl-CoA synthase